MFKIDQMPFQPLPPTSDWIAWLTTDDGHYVMVQISGKASQERASEILHQMAGIVRHSETV